MSDVICTKRYNYSKVLWADLSVFLIYFGNVFNFLKIVFLETRILSYTKSNL